MRGGRTRKNKKLFFLSLRLFCEQNILVLDIVQDIGLEPGLKCPFRTVGICTPIFLLSFPDSCRNCYSTIPPHPTLLFYVLIPCLHLLTANQTKIVLKLLVKMHWQNN